jgi:hypothetical protein
MNPSSFAWSLGLLFVVDLALLFLGFSLVHFRVHRKAWARLFLMKNAVHLV